MSKLLTNQISNYNDNGPVEAKEGLNVATGKPLQVAGANGTSGDYLKSTGSSIEWSTFPSIPAAQVNVDWNSTSGITQILNKPNLSTVATTGSYNDLINLPTIPDAQVNSDWNANSGLARILNKPTIFSGNYADLSGRPSIPATITDLSDVNLPNPIPDVAYLRWDSSTVRWITGASAGIGNIVEDTSPQLGATLDLNGHDITGGTSSTIEVSGDTSKIKFLYQNLGDLPSASTWHGMFAHVHAQGHGYFAHGGAWTQLIDEGSSIGELSDVNTSGASVNDVLKWNGTAWTAQTDATGGGGGGGGVTSDAQNNTVAGTNAGDAFVGADANNNTLFGYNAGTSITDGDKNTGVGCFALEDVTTGSWNTAVGQGALKGITSTGTNTAVGRNAGMNSNGSSNTFIGDTAGDYSGGSDNVIIGRAAGRFNNNSNNIIIGANASGSATTATNEITLGDTNITKFRVPGINFAIKDSTATENYVLTVDANGEAGWAAASGGGGSGATVTTADTAPTTPSDGDLWWKSDEGRLKVYYTDTNTSQWVDANPPLSVAEQFQISSESTDTECYPLFSKDATGNLEPKTVTSLKLNSSSGQLEAGSFKKTGGSSSEFLKADGSTDSTSYSTFSGSYADLTNKPTLFSGNYTELTNKPNIPSNLNGLSDVTTGSITTGDLLTYDGSVWAAAAPATPTRVWILDGEDVSSSGANWGGTKLVTGIPTGGANGTTPYKRIVILFGGVAFSNPGSGQIRIRLGTSNNGIDNQYYTSASTDGAGNTWTSDNCFIIGKTTSKGAGPQLSGRIVLDRNGGGASGGSFGEIVETHTILEHSAGNPTANSVYTGSGLKSVFQADNFDRLEFSVDNQHTGGNNVNLTGMFHYGEVSIYVEY